MAIILATWKAEIRRIAVQGQPGEGGISATPLIQTITGHCAYHATREAEIKKMVVQASLGKK
jgi:hypothetical protein